MLKGLQQAADDFTDSETAARVRTNPKRDHNEKLKFSQVFHRPVEDQLVKRLFCKAL